MERPRDFHFTIAARPLRLNFDSVYPADCNYFRQWILISWSSDSNSG